MRRYVLGLVLWLPVGLLRAAYAQSAPVTSADTVRAVHQLFQARRTGGVVFGLLGSSYTGIGAAAVHGKQPTSTYGPDVISEMGLGIGVPLLALGLSKLLRFGTGREQRILAEYQAGRALPHSILVKLKTKHFRQGQ